MKFLDHIELLSHDFERLLERSKPCLDKLNGASLLITGGSGFFGTWLAHTFYAALSQGKYQFDIHIVCREPGRFLDLYPYFKDHRSFHFHSHNVMYPIVMKTKLDYIVHAATSASAKLNAEQPLQMIDTIVTGTRHVLDLAISQKVKNFVFTSSGAIYGAIDYGVKINEAALSGPDLKNPRSAYGEAKRLAELLCHIYDTQYGLRIQILRCFAFIGPFMIFDSHFAAGNFIMDALQNKAPFIKGDHRTVRSYLYGADLVASLLLALSSDTTESEEKVVNVGSDIPVSIEELAELTRVQLGVAEPVVFADHRKLNSKIDWYVPSIDKFKHLYDFSMDYDLAAAVSQTGSWLRAVRQFQGVN